MNIQDILNICIESTLFSAIALYSYLFISGFMARKSRVSPGQLELPLYPVATVEPEPEAAPQVEAIAPVAIQDNIVAFKRPQKAAVEAIDYSTMSAPELRQLCSRSGIRWRNAKGKSKHLSKAEMIQALQLRRSA